MDDSNSYYDKNINSGAINECVCTTYICPFQVCHTVFRHILHSKGVNAVKTV